MKHSRGVRKGCSGVCDMIGRLGGLLGEQGGGDGELFQKENARMG